MNATGRRGIDTGYAGPSGGEPLTTALEAPGKEGQTVPVQTVVARIETLLTQSRTTARV